MGKKEEKFQSELDRANLEKSFYEMVYLQGLSVKDVAKKYGFSRQTVYVYLRNCPRYPRIDPLALLEN
jgi:transposase